MRYFRVKASLLRTLGVLIGLEITIALPAMEPAILVLADHVLPPIFIDNVIVLAQ